MSPKKLTLYRKLKIIIIRLSALGSEHYKRYSITNQSEVLSTKNYSTVIDCYNLIRSNTLFHQCELFRGLKLFPKILQPYLFPAHSILTILLDKRQTKNCLEDMNVLIKTNYTKCQLNKETDFAGTVMLKICVLK